MEGFHPVLALRSTLHFNFFILQYRHFVAWQLCQVCELLHMTWVASGHGTFSHCTCLAANPEFYFSLYDNGDILLHGNCAECVNCCM